MKDKKELGMSGETNFKTIFNFLKKAGLKYNISEVEIYDFKPNENAEMANQFMYYNNFIKFYSKKMKKVVVQISRKLKGNLVFLAFFFLMFLLVGCNVESDIKFPVKVGVKPESITKGFNGNYYVTVMNGKENGDGELVEISNKGVNVFSKGFNEPKGIVYLKEHLYFSDLNCVWKVDIDGNKSVFVKKEDFPEEVLYLNDVAVDGDENGIYVADMGATSYMRDGNNNLWPLESDEAKLIPQLGRIYHVNLEGKVTITQNTNPLMLNPNGVGVDNNNNIMVSSFFLGNFLVIRDGKLTPLKGEFRGGDGVEQDNEGNYYISSWTEGKVWKINGETEESTVLVEGLKSAADFYLEESKGRMLVPDMMAGMVYAIDINSK